MSGGLGENTELDDSVHPPIISKLHYKFDGWLGDDLLESFPCCVASANLKRILEDSDLSGYQFDDFEVTQSEQFKELYPSKELPKFYWLKINGEVGKNDFAISRDNRIVVPCVALSILKKDRIENADIEEVS